MGGGQELWVRNFLFGHKEQEKQEKFLSSCLLLIFVAYIIFKLKDASKICQNIRLRHLDRYLEEAVEGVGGVLSISERLFADKPKHPM